MSRLEYIISVVLTVVFTVLVGGLLASIYLRVISYALSIAFARTYQESCTYRLKRKRAGRVAIVVARSYTQPLHNKPTWRAFLLMAECSALGIRPRDATVPILTALVPTATGGTMTFEWEQLVEPVDRELNALGINPFGGDVDPT